jgi:hypothetical protein
MTSATSVGGDGSLRGTLLMLAALDEAPGADAADTLARAVAQLRTLQGEHNVALLDDHDPSLADGFYVARGAPPEPARLREIMRSWERFDRAFAPCPTSEERALIDTRVWPFLVAAGLAGCARALTREHLFVVDGRYAGSFSDERWDAHASRQVVDMTADEREAAAPALAGDKEARLLRGLAHALRAARGAPTNAGAPRG